MSNVDREGELQALFESAHNQMEAFRSSQILEAVRFLVGTHAGSLSPRLALREKRFGNMFVKRAISIWAPGGLRRSEGE